MSKGVNKAIIVGNLGKDPEIRYTASGSAIANCTIATSETWKDKQSGEKQEKTEWHRVVFFNRLAEVVAEYVKKGQQIYIEGRIQTRKWQNQEGKDQYTTEIVADKMQMLGGRQDTAPKSQPAAPQQASAPQAGIDDFDSDVPF